MEYSKIIEPYLIDFDKLEVGQPLWSLQYGKIIIVHIDKEEIEITYAIQDAGKTKQQKFTHSFAYKIFFTANPFDNLQVVEPLEDIKLLCAFQHWLGTNYNNLPTDSVEMTNRGRKYLREDEAKNTFPELGGGLLNALKNQPLESKVVKFDHFKNQPLDVEAEAEKFLKRKSIDVRVEIENEDGKKIINVESLLIDFAQKHFNSGKITTK